MASDGSIILDTGMDNDGFEKDAEKLKKAIDSVVSSAKKDADKIGNQFSRMGDALSMGLKTDSQTKRFQLNLTHASDSVQQLTQKIYNLRNQKIPTESYQNITKEVKNAEKALFRLYDKQDELAINEPIRKSWREIQHQIEMAESAVEKYKAKKEKTEKSGNALGYIRITEELQDAENKLIELQEKQNEFKKESGISKILHEWELLQKQIQIAETKLEQYESTKSKLEQSGNAFVSGSDTQEVSALTGKLQDLQQKLLQYESVAKSFDGISPGAKQSSSSVNALRTSMKKAVSTAASMAKQLAKMALSKVANGFKNIAKRMRIFSSEGKSARITANKITSSLLRLKTMLISRVKESLITQIFNQAKESMKSLALFSKEFDSSMSSITNGSKQLSANLAVSLGNLVNAVTPALTAIMDVASRAFTYLNSFFAMLSGKNTVIVAKKQTGSYADSLREASESAKDTSDAVAELNNELYGFDEITKQSADDAKGFEQSSGIGSMDGSDIFETVAIESIVPQQVKSYMDSLKDAIKSGDWYNVGSIAASGLNQAIQAADAFVTGTLTPKIVGWVQNITSVLNGFVDNFNWYNLGTLIGDSLNGIFLAFDTFLTNFHALNLGMGIGNAINGMFDGINWKLAGKTVGDGLNSISDLIYGFGSTIKWKDIAFNLADGFNSALRTWNPLKTAKAIFSLINGGVKLAATLLKEIKWGELVTKILDFLKLSIEEFDWASAGGLISSIIDAAFEILNALLDYDWEEFVTELGNGIGTMLGNIDWETILTDLVEVALKLFKFIFTAKFLSLEFIASILEAFFREIGLDSIAGFFGGIEEKMKGIKQFIEETLFSPVVKWVKDLFGIHSPSKVFAEIGGFLMEGMKNGASSKIQSVLQKFSEIKNAVVESFSDMKDRIKGKFSSAFEKAKEAWDGAESHFSEVKEGIVSKFSTFKDDVKSKFESARDSILEIDWWSVGDGMLGGIMSGISNTTSSIASWGEGFVQDFKNFFGIHSPSKLFEEEVGYYIGAGVAKGVEDASGLVSSSASLLSTSMASKLNHITVEPSIKMPSTASLRKIASSYPAPSVLNAMPNHTKSKIARGETFSSNPNNAIKMDLLLTKLDAIISKIGDSNNTGIEKNENTFILKLGEKEIATSVVRQINQITRATGRSPLLSR